VRRAENQQEDLEVLKGLEQEWAWYLELGTSLLERVCWDTEQGLGLDLLQQVLAQMYQDYLGRDCLVKVSEPVLQIVQDSFTFSDCHTMLA
jgi:hypothetical protein